MEACYGDSGAAAGRHRLIPCGSSNESTRDSGVHRGASLNFQHRSSSGVGYAPLILACILSMLPPLVFGGVVLAPPSPAAHDLRDS